MIKMQCITCLSALSSARGCVGKGHGQQTDMCEDLLYVQCFCLFSPQIWNITSLGCRGLHNCHTIEKRLTAASFQKKNMETKHQKKSLAFSTLRVHNENSSIAICCENGKPSSAFQGKKKGGAGCVKHRYIDSSKEWLWREFRFVSSQQT